MSSPEPTNLSVVDICSLHKSGSLDQITLDATLRAVLAEKELVTAWRHPLGFAHLELTSAGQLPQGERFRLHYWTTFGGVQDGLGDLHEHTWDLRSLVLAGQVIDTNLDAIPDDNGAYRGARINYSDVNTSQVAGRFALQPSVRRVVNKGGMYEIPSRTVHLNEVGVLPTVTLVHSREDGLGRGPLVFSSIDSEGGPVTAQRQRIDVAAALQELLRAFGSGAELS